MDLKRKFFEAEGCDVIKVVQMVLNIRSSEPRRSTRSFEGVSVEDSPEQLVKVFLPNRYSVLYTDDDIECIKSKVVELHLIYKGTCQNTKSHKLGIE